MVAALFIAGRLAGAHIFDNNWSFLHWSNQSWWWNGSCLAFLLAGWLLLGPRAEAIGRALARPSAAKLALLVAFALVLVFQSDSFIWSGGNTRIAQIAQVPVIVHRWYEFGASITVAFIYERLVDLGFEGNAAGFWAWRGFSWLTTLFAFLGAVRLSRHLSSGPAMRPWLFLITLAGPQFIALFGYTGPEVAIVPILLWASALMIDAIQEPSVQKLQALLGILVVGCFFHISAAVVFPALVYTLLTTIRNESHSSRMPLVVGVATLLAMVAAIYVVANLNFGLRRYLLFLSAKGPFGDYRLISGRRIGDIFQIFCLVAPWLVVVKLGLWRRWRAILADSRIVVVSLLTLSAGTLVGILDPLHGIVIDLPRLLVYLTPFGVFAAIWPAFGSDQERPRLAAFLAVFVLFTGLSYLPTYLHLRTIEPQFENYCNKHDWYYRTGTIALRDAFFFQKDMDAANGWDQRQAIRSPDELNIRGVNDLVMSERTSEAINILHAIKVRNPWWLEPRSMLAGLQRRVGQFDLARAETDTMAMIDPYRREYLMNEYAYWRERRDNLKAVQAINRALEIWPGDPEILTDLLRMYHRVNDYMAADTLAARLIETQPELPYPHLFKGMMEESRQNPIGAETYYREFLRLAPVAPEAAEVRQRLRVIDSLKAAG